ncbi:hypothetical protein AVEN_109327-1 [Araneus ventricosus]|uniref:Uncharacterized protein n=1 Tax=Araneus ventricosus TaxID=182803 RepID=A0A4Y2D1I6_ARAVE|nr:hypothetical protein AVEN_109327-1 [Araneus ventricosus]
MWCPQPTSTVSPIGFRVHRDERALVWCGNLGRGYQLGCRPRLLTAVPYYEMELGSLDSRLKSFVHDIPRWRCFTGVFGRR